MKQNEAVLFTLEKLGGQATLGQLYQNVMQVEDCEWKTNPFCIDSPDCANSTRNL
jgi:hypothetical protein